jgi:aminoglycoside 3-N-acetyltransferase
VTRLSLAQFRDAFARIVPADDEVIVVYSGIWSFGHLFGLPPLALANGLIDAMLEAIGPARTLVMPAYTSDFPRRRVFDLMKTPAYTGVLPNLFRLRPDVQRTPKPMDSYAAYGPQADELVRRPCTTAWGNDSVLGFFDQVNARQVVFGAPWHLACAYVHRCEEVARVPYRYFKRFSGEFLVNDVQQGRCEEVMYVRPFDVDPKLSYKRIRDEMARRNLVVEAIELPELGLECASSRDILDTSLRLLEADPFVFVGARDEVARWVDEGRERELARLRPDEIFVV